MRDAIRRDRGQSDAIRGGQRRSERPSGRRLPRTDRRATRVAACGSPRDVSPGRGHVRATQEVVRGVIRGVIGGHRRSSEVIGGHRGHYLEVRTCEGVLGQVLGTARLEDQCDSNLDRRQGGPSITAHQRPPVIISAHQCSSVLISAYQWSAEAITGHHRGIQRQSGAIRPTGTSGYTEARRRCRRRSPRDRTSPGAPRPVQRQVARRGAAVWPDSRWHAPAGR